MDVILNRLPLNEEEKAAFLAAAPGIEQVFLPAPNLSSSETVIPPELLGRITVSLGSLPVQLLPQCGSLKWLQTFSAGVNQFMPDGVFPEGAMLTSAVGAYGQAVAEHMFACLLALMKRLPEYRDKQKTHAWAPGGRVKTLQGATVLLLGTGDLGSHFARLVKAMGAHTVGLNRHPDRPVEGIDEVHPFGELDTWLPQANVVAMTLPETPETIHIMDSRRLGLLRPDAILINAGRGTAVDCLALAEALRTEKLWGAALDVTEPEPLPADHPLWDCKNLLLTPHVAGGARSEDVLRRLAALALDNLKRYLSGEELRNRMK
ncbi:MAG: D-2-hydroxyacid dehydrogenase [Oscillospiraceae bacterium]|nr:D-2-hydroxyacid dehydrogenase [Oscillospiraceae bacterium]